MNEEQYKAEIEYLKDKINEIDEYYRNIIEQKDDEIANLQDEIKEMKYM